MASEERYSTTNREDCVIRRCELSGYIGASILYNLWMFSLLTWLYIYIYLSSGCHAPLATKWRLDQVFLARHRLMMMMMMMMMMMVVMMMMMMDCGSLQNSMMPAADLLYGSLAEKPPTTRSVLNPHQYAFLMSSRMIPNISSPGNTPIFLPQPQWIAHQQDTFAQLVSNMPVPLEDPETCSDITIATLEICFV